MRRGTIIVGLAATALTAAACTSNASHTASSRVSTAPSTSAVTAPADAVADLAPTGTLRLAVAASPPFLAHGSPPTGVAVELAAALASRLGVPLTTTVYPDAPSLLAAARMHSWDVAVLPIVPAATAALDFSGPILLVPHTLLVGAGKSMRTFADADNVGIRIASEAGSAHTPILAGQLHHATLVQVQTKAEGLAMLKAGQVDAFADGRFEMGADGAQVPGSTVLSDNFFIPRVGAAVTHGHGAGLAYLTAFAEEFKASGAVQSAISAAGLLGVPVAPAGSGVTTPSPTSAGG